MTARLILLLLGAVIAARAEPQWLTYRGYLENRTLLYPREAENDPAHLVNETLLRFEGEVRLPAGLRLLAGFDSQIDTHHQAQRKWQLSWDDRTLQSPAFAVRTLMLRYARGPFRLEAGKQVVRWGVIDLFPPSDRFAPVDLLSPSGADYLGVYAARAVVDTGPHSLELLYLPRFTPTRLPLAGQRWVITPPGLPASRLRLTDTRYPGGPQFGVRYHRVEPAAEYSVSYAEGFNHFPSLPYRLNLGAGTIDYQRVYPKFRSVGADVTAAWQGLLWKAESAYSASPPDFADDVWTYAFQVEKLAGPWQIAAGYAGEHVTKERDNVSVEVDRALRDAFAGRVAWAPSLKHSASADWYFRPDPWAWIARIQYDRRLYSTLRLAAAWNWIAGERDSTIGRYGRNSYFSLQLRYSF